MLPPGDQELLDAVLAAPGERAAARVAKAITLVESTRADHRRARRCVARRAAAAHAARRSGSASPASPGVGKSTFIEALGLYLIGAGHRVAVLAVDPSARLSGGSILGDKTRMERLSVDSRRVHPAVPVARLARRRGGEDARGDAASARRPAST